MNVLRRCLSCRPASRRILRVDSLCRRAITSTSIDTPRLDNTEHGYSDDFAHHVPDVARLNHASFGAVPRSVLQAQEEFRQIWLAQPDELYFSGRLQVMMRRAAQAGSQTLSGTKLLPTPQHVCLMENATVATCAVAYHWSKMIQPGDVIVHLDIAYKACIHILREYCESKGARLVSLTVPFPVTTTDEILVSLTTQLQQLHCQGIHPRFAFLDHVSSQPSILLPVADMIRVVREFAPTRDPKNLQVCVDGAHTVGSVPYDWDVTQLDCDYYYSNLHKWGFAPSTATIFWSPQCPEMRHPITSWGWGQGLAEETLFPGTRDFSAMAAVPAAVDYLDSWRSREGQTSAVYCHQQVQNAADYLRDAWGTASLDPPMDPALVATQAMVRLPPALHVTDRPGQVSRGVREILRQDYRIEAAVGNFGDRGNFLRLSWAVYNNMSEIERLAKAVLEIEHGQK